MLTVKTVLNKIKTTNPTANLKKIEKAYNFAKKCHTGQTRGTGESYIQHPLEVAYNLADFKFNTPTYIAALLHDTVEDTNTDIEVIQKEFGKEVAELVYGVTKLAKIQYKNNLDVYRIESLRKMFLAMAKDLRVILIKLFDRLHNLKTLKGLSREQQKRIAIETIEIYAPLAFRLGIGELKGQLEDLAFSFISQKDYEWISKLVAEEKIKRSEHVEKTKKELIKILHNANIDYVDIHGRTKHLYSLYKKLHRYNNDINNIYDILALRVIVKDVADCYRTLGIIHQEWKPLLGRIKDYIAVPKTNGYQSLHTTVITNDEQIFEIQIRTLKMHQEAEYGLAASWFYHEQEKPQNIIAVPKNLTWIGRLAEWQKEIQDSNKFAESVKIDFLQDRIFVFTPNGDVLDLPEKSTPIDFAYQIHTDVGNHYSGALVNNKFVSLDYELKNGDVAKIFTNEKTSPSHDWLNFVRTKLAQNRIKTWLKKQNRQKNIEYGKNLLNEELEKLKHETAAKLSKEKLKILLDKLSYKTLDDLLEGIGCGDVSVQEIIRTVYKEEELFTPRQRQFIFFGKPILQPRAIIENEEGLLTNIAKCCHPTIKDKITAYITRSSGASIHKNSCKELKKLAKKNGGRVLSAHWEKNSHPYCLVDIELQTLDRVGLLRDVSRELANLKVNIANLKLSRQFKNNDIASISLTLEVQDIDQLVYILEKLEKIKGVLKVVRK